MSSNRSADLKGRFDSLLFGLVLSLGLISILLLLSIAGVQEQAYWRKQIVWYVIGLSAMVGVTVVPRRFWFIGAFALYTVLLLPLGFTSVAAKGAERWFALGGFHFQPSEFAKLGVLLALARLFSERTVNLSNLKALVVPFLVFFVPFILILKQPNLSTALSLAAVFLSMMFWSGFKLTELAVLVSPIASVILSFQPRWWFPFNLVGWFILWWLWKTRQIPGRIAVFFLLAILAAGLMSQVAWNNILKSHQRSRILTFIDPTRDPGGAGYQVIQSQVAIGSGGALGKGFGQGSQSNLQFLPEEHTDFIFSVLAEQFGFAGCVLVLALFFGFLVRSLQICLDYSDRFTNLVAVGATTIFTFHILVNISMTLGLMPVTGLPLPFLSYGGSFVITCLVLVGFLLQIRLGDSE